MIPLSPFPQRDLFGYISADFTVLFTHSPVARLLMQNGVSGKAFPGVTLSFYFLDDQFSVSDFSDTCLIFSIRNASHYYCKLPLQA